MCSFKGKKTLKQHQVVCRDLYCFKNNKKKNVKYFPCLITFKIISSAVTSFDFSICVIIYYLKKMTLSVWIKTWVFYIIVFSEYISAGWKYIFLPLDCYTQLLVMMFDPSVEVKHINVKNAISRELFYRILDFQEQ